MDEEYFARIEKGKIRNAIEAQAYFQEKRMLPILAVREENIKRVALYTFQVDQVMRHYPLIWKYPTQPESINITPSK